MRRLLALTVCVLAAAPLAARQFEATDGYVFKRKQDTHLRLDVQIVEHSSHAELRAAMPDQRRNDRQVRAWSIVGPGIRCEIHIVDPAVSYSPEALGHELTHCIHGEWHD